jgi:hypothetical protein
VTVGARVRWRFFDGAFAGLGALLAAPRERASAALEEPRTARASASMEGHEGHEGAGSGVVRQAEELARAIDQAARARIPGQPALAEGIALAALVDALWSLARLPRDANPIVPLRALWATGYVLVGADDAGTTLAMPALSETPAS